MMEKTQHITYRKIFVFWVPLAATWLMMSLEGPFLAAVIARMVEPKFNLAAYGVALSFALVVESPIIMIMSAATALVKDRQSFLKMRNFSYTLNAMITIGMIIGLIPPIFDFIAKELIGLPENVAHLTYVASILFIPWPAAIGFRRFYHGILIRYNRTRFVAYGTMIRLMAMASTAWILYMFTNFEGAYVGAASLSVGVFIETVISRLMVGKIIRKLLAEKEKSSSNQDLTYGYIAKFYYPLALTAMLALGVYPLITFFVGKSRMALESLAVLPVINSLSFIFRSIGLSYQEVGIAMMGRKGENYIRLRNFALVVGGLTTVGLGLLAFTPAAIVWFHDISGLSMELTDFSLFPTQLLVLLPFLTMFISFQRAVLVHGHFTGPVTLATAIEVLSIILILFVGIYHFDLYGAVVAALAMTVGRLLATGYLIPSCSKVVRSLPEVG